MISTPLIQVIQKQKIVTCSTQTLLGHSRDPPYLLALLQPPLQTKKQTKNIPVCSEMIPATVYGYSFKFVVHVIVTKTYNF